MANYCQLVNCAFNGGELEGHYTQLALLRVHLVKEAHSSAQLSCSQSEVAVKEEAKDNLHTRE